MPTGERDVHTEPRVYGTINGLNYGIWTKRDGGSITVFPAVHCVQRIMGQQPELPGPPRPGLPRVERQTLREYGTILAEFVEQKHGDPGGFAMIGHLRVDAQHHASSTISRGLLQRPLGSGDVTVTIDGGPYFSRPPRYRHRCANAC
jgi:hypothetical protein